MSDRILSNRYKLESEIGRGGMGVVYRATDTEVKRTVAIKTLPAVMSHNQDLMRRFTSEVQHASKLEHPNIVRVYDVGEDSGTHFYVMQYIDGSDLRSQMKSKGRCSVDETISIISQVADALDYAHSQGIVHRDIKPENILLDSDGVAHVADFGIAKATEGTRTTQGMLGTPEYMSPEQVKGKSVDGRSDQYSLAVVAYEMLTGRTPFKTEGDDPWAQINMHLNTPVPNPRTTVPDIPTHVANALLQALAKKPEQRFGSCGELVRALKGEIEVTASYCGYRSKLHRRAMFIGIAGVILAGLLLAFLSLRQGQDSHLPSDDKRIVEMIAYTKTGRGQDGRTQLYLATTSGRKYRIGYMPEQNVCVSPDASFVYSAEDGAVPTDIGIITGVAVENTKIGKGIWNLDMSPDGRLVAYEDNRGEVVVRKLGTKELKRIGKGSTPVFSPDGRHIAYFDDTPSPNKRLVIADLENGSKRNFCVRDKNGGQILLLSRSAFSPDSRQIVLNTSHQDICQISLKTGTSKYVTSDLWEIKDQIVNRNPAFSSDGTLYYYRQESHFDEDGNDAGRTYEIRSVTSNGTTRAVLAGNGFGDEGFIISPDGRSLAFSDRDRGLCVKDLSSGEVTIVDASASSPSRWVSVDEECLRKLESRQTSQAEPLWWAKIAGSMPGYIPEANYSSDLDGDDKMETAFWASKDGSSPVVCIVKEDRVIWRRACNMVSSTGPANSIESLRSYAVAPGNPILVFQEVMVFVTGCVYEFRAYRFENGRIADCTGTAEGYIPGVRIIDVDTNERMRGLVAAERIHSDDDQGDSAPHRWNVQFYKWNGSQFVLFSSKVTSRKYDDILKGLEEMGISTHLARYRSICKDPRN